MQDNQNNKKIILLVEDDPLLIKMYSTKFSLDGFELIVAQDGMEGLKKAQENKIDFIVMDVMMPKLSGIDLFFKLKELNVNVPTLFLTNLSQPEEEKKVLEAGAKEYLLKANLTPHEIVTKIKGYLGIS